MTITRKTFNNLLTLKTESKQQSENIYIYKKVLKYTITISKQSIFFI